MNKTTLNAMITMSEKITQLDQQKDDLLQAFATWIKVNYDANVSVTYDGTKYTIEQMTQAEMLGFETERNVEHLFYNLELLGLIDAATELENYLSGD